MIKNILQKWVMKYCLQQLLIKCWGFSFVYHTQKLCCLSQGWSWLENKIIEINTKNNWNHLHPLLKWTYFLKLSTLQKLLSDLTIYLTVLHMIGWSKTNERLLDKSLKRDLLDVGLKPELKITPRIYCVQRTICLAIMCSQSITILNMHENDHNSYKNRRIKMVG